jgi:uncharacterized membrane protein
MSDESSKKSAGIFNTKWLVVSVASNLFLAGLLIGSWLSAPWHGSGMPPRPPLQMMIQEASGKLSPDGLAKLSGLADELESRFRRDISASGPLRDRVREEMVRELFDEVAFAKALSDMNQEFAKGHGVVNKRFAEVIASLSLRDRQQLGNIRFP